MEAILKRRSIRKYKDTPVEQTKIVTMLEAARNAPSGGNLQDWKFIIVTDSSARRVISEACLKQYWMETAPLHIVIVSTPEKSIQHYGERGKFYATQNCAAAAQNIVLAATSEGLATCWVSAFDEALLKQAINCPGRATPEVILTVGYPDEEVPVPFKTPLENVVFLQRYANRVRSPDLVYWDISLAMERKVKESAEAIKRGARNIKDKLTGKYKDIKKRATEDLEGDPDQ